MDWDLIVFDKLKEIKQQPSPERMIWSFLFSSLSFNSSCSSTWCVFHHCGAHTHTHPNQCLIHSLFQCRFLSCRFNHLISPRSCLIICFPLLIHHLSIPRAVRMIGLLLSKTFCLLSFSAYSWWVSGEIQIHFSVYRTTAYSSFPNQFLGRDDKDAGSTEKSHTYWNWFYFMSEYSRMELEMAQQCYKKKLQLTV